MSPRRCFLLLLLSLLTAAGPLASCRPSAPAVAEFRQSRLLLGTVVEIVALGPEREVLEGAVGAAFTEIARIEGLMTPHHPASDVARLTAAAGPLEVSAETAAVIARGLQVAAASGGAFDLTLGRLKDLWAIEGEAPHLPTAAELARALAGTGPGSLTLTGRTVSKRDPALAVDLGGIAKGYAVDRAIAVLAEGGVKLASVNAGGDIRVLGDRAGRPWRIGIQHPRQPGEILATIELADVAVVTSGDYERFFERDGVRYHHLFDPRTGLPARRCQAVTVVASEAVLSDALATAVFVLGPGPGLELLRHFPGVEGLVVAADGTVTTTPGLSGRLTWR
jgi:thiamine biosynthesis lipoprotein